MIAKNMAVTGIYLLHKIWCNIQKNDHMIATIALIQNKYAPFTKNRREFFTIQKKMRWGAILFDKAFS
jgi:hypothetical protein